MQARFLKLELVDGLLAFIVAVGGGYLFEVGERDQVDFESARSVQKAAWRG